MTRYVRYDDDLEQIADDEPQTFATIAEMMTKAQHDVRAKAGESVRVSHAKAHGFATGTLTVLPDLPPELAQGLFATPGVHDVLVRLSQAPGEVLDDRRVSSQRGLALKVFGVDGPKLAGHEGARTQDFVFDTSKVFIASNAKEFLAAFLPNAFLAPKLPEVVKGAVSKAAEAANAVAHAVGGDLPKLDIYGHPAYHPLAEAYYSQIPLRYGDHVAKLALVPANPALAALHREKVDLDDADALRRATVKYFRTTAAEYEVKVQLAMPGMSIEDPMEEWSEDASPYRTVARLVLPPQDAFRLQEPVDHQLSFSPAHALAAHRPLGSIGRARLHVYPLVAGRRRTENGQPLVEPRSLAEVVALRPAPVARARRRPLAGTIALGAVASLLLVATLGFAGAWLARRMRS